jgi:hypothetical protein
MPAGRFRVRSMITGQEVGVFGNSDWAHGVTIKFPDSSPVEVVEVSSVS